MKSRFAVVSSILGLSALVLGACATDDSHGIADIPKPPSVAAAAAPAATAPVAVTTPNTYTGATTVNVDTIKMTTKVDFAKSVKPFFADYCIRCHGPTRQSGGGIRYDDKTAALGHAGLITPGAPGNSALYAAISSTGRNHMPPATADQPEADDIAMIKQWITEGANWPDGQ